MSAIAERPRVATLVGTPDEVQARLDKTDANQVLLLSFESMKPEIAHVLADNLANVAASMLELLLERQSKQAIDLLVQALLPSTPPSPRLLKEAAMLIRARKAVLDSGDWLTAAQVTSLAGLSTRNPSAQPNKWKKQGLIFAINHAGVDHFPGYGLDRDAGFRPIKALAEVIAVLTEHKDAWGMAFWFLSDNSFLGGERPQDLLSAEPGRVIAAAEDEVAEIAHA